MTLRFSKLLLSKYLNIIYINNSITTNPNYIKKNNKEEVAQPIAVVKFDIDIDRIMKLKIITKNKYMMMLFELFYNFS